MANSKILGIMLLCVGATNANAMQLTSINDTNVDTTRILGVLQKGENCRELLMSYGRPLEFCCSLSGTKSTFDTEVKSFTSKLSTMVEKIKLMGVEIVVKERREAPLFVKMCE